MELQHIEAAEWIGALRFRLRFADGAEGIVDLAPELGDDPGVLAVIRDRPEGFAIAPHGRALVWRDDAGEDVDMDADTLRLLCKPRRRAAAE